MQNYVIDDYQKGINTQATTDTLYDKPDKKQKHPHYEHRTAKMMKKNNEFSEKKFQKIRHVSNEKKLLKSFSRIGRCLNHVSRDEMPKNGYKKVCLILMNTIEHKKHDPKIGALNDGYLFGLYHHRLGFNIFYLYNCIQGNYPKYLQFFLFHTTENLTVFYSGPDTVDDQGRHGVEFSDTTVTAYQLGHVISRDNNGKCKVVFVTDCTSSGSVFDLCEVNTLGNPHPSPMLSFYVDKSTDSNSKEGRRTHGIFTYYLCKIIYDEPAVTATRVVERLNGFMGRFGEHVRCEPTKPEIMDQPVYDPYPHPEDDPVDEWLASEEADNDDDDDDDHPDYKYANGDHPDYKYANGNHADYKNVNDEPIRLSEKSHVMSSVEI